MEANIMAIYTTVDDGYDVEVFTSVKKMADYIKGMVSSPGEKLFFDDYQGEEFSTSALRKKLKTDCIVWIYKEDCEGDWIVKIHSH
jgi:hypothetical protein